MFTNRLILAFMLFGAAETELAAQQPSLEEKILQAAGIGGDGPSLVKFLHSLVPAKGDPEAVVPLVKALGSEEFFEREEAFKKLIALGAKALPHLRQAVKDADRERAARAEKCLKIIEGGPGIEVHGAALRMLAKLKPLGAAEGILEYLPFAADQKLTEEATSALSDVALQDGKVNPALLPALQDKQPMRRAAAGAALAKHSAAHLPEVRKLLADPDLSVRLRVGLALINAKEKTAVPVLINLLDKLPGQTGPVEEILYRLAGDQAPAAGTPEQARKVWMDWWQAHEAKIDLAKLTQATKLLGKTLIVGMAEGFVQEVDDKGKALWKIANLNAPICAQVVGEDRVLIVEYRGQMVSERKFNGEMVWQYRGVFPVAAQRLPGGRTFVAFRNRLVELDNQGKQVSTKVVPGHLIMGAQRLPNGQVVAVTSAGVFLRLNVDGKEIQRNPIGFGFTLGNGFDAAPNGRVIIPQPNTEKILELDPQGKVTREWKYPTGATSVQRLPNGNLLVCSPSQRKVVELNERGQVVAELAVEGSPHRATRR